MFEALFAAPFTGSSLSRDKTTRIAAVRTLLALSCRTRESGAEIGILTGPLAVE